MELACQETVKRTLPVNFVKSDNVLFKDELWKDFGAIESIKFENVLMLPNGVVVKHGILAATFFNQPKVPIFRFSKLYLKVMYSLLKSKKTISFSHGILLTDHFSVGFFHWLGDVLQKLEALDEKNVDISQYTFLIPSTCVHDYIYKTLQVYGLRYFVIDESTRVKVEELLYIPQIAPTGNYRRELMQNMRARFAAYFLTKKPGKRIYITREKAQKRKIINESSLLPILKRYGFQIIAMEDFTFSEQYKIIAEANVLVSLHGAGLTNMLWLDGNKQSKVLEIRAKDDASNNCFFSLASDLDIDYYYCFAEKVNNKSTQLTDFKIDPETFELVLEEVMG